MQYDSVIHVTQGSDENWLQISFLKICKDGGPVDAKSVRLTKEQLSKIWMAVCNKTLPLTVQRAATVDSEMKEVEKA